MYRKQSIYDFELQLSLLAIMFYLNSLSKYSSPSPSSPQQNGVLPEMPLNFLKFLPKAFNTAFTRV
jgi:hypothetical protein